MSRVLRNKSIGLNNDKCPIVMIVIWSVFVLFFQSKNSPLYVLNDWVDLNVFLTIGKSWANGLIPYRDLFEQKGPTLFFVFYLISKIKASYVMIYLVEVVFFSFSLFFLYKIARFYYEKLASLFFVFLCSVILTLTPYFDRGGSAEELAYPFIIYSIYLLFVFYHEEFVSDSQWLKLGLSFAWVFWSKYTLIGVFIAVIIGIVIDLMLQKNYRRMIEVILYTSLGFILLTSIVVVYFYFQGAIKSLYFAYFYSNIKLYPNDNGGTIIGKIVNAFIIFFNQLKKNEIVFMTMIIGSYQLVMNHHIFKNKGLMLNYFFALSSMIVTTFFGGKSYDYYLLSILPIMCVALLPLIKNFNQTQFTNFHLMISALLTLLMIIGINGRLTESKLFPNNQTISLDGRSTKPAQQIFSEIINKEKNPTLLNYGSIDMGLYQAADILPSNYYFQRVNISNEKMPQIMNEQKQVVEEQKVMFVVIRLPKKHKKEDIPEIIRNNYQLVKKTRSIFCQTVELLFVSIK
ncbi:glycosyltransferase family 39 protein [Vagococcus xieshaowenii]|uniref:Glycosyltransferase RgtA/B/C/D-like domain-containing protein n=1 Tax=Vagococcus xieshaowenii TaxID=2562451 RepID=A0ABX5TF40_9ENTE|nr:glycosyltransferase family 39 protein [Vagococcus xieshaowenii]QCA29257.1 hypothetical protein E4Z98_07970 [Vagococcus xieshaowenii]